MLFTSRDCTVFRLGGSQQQYRPFCEIPELCHTFVHINGISSPGGDTNSNNPRVLNATIHACSYLCGTSCFRWRCCEIRSAANSCVTASCWRSAGALPPPAGREGNCRLKVTGAQTSAVAGGTRPLLAGGFLTHSLKLAVQKGFY